MKIRSSLLTAALALAFVSGGALAQEPRPDSGELKPPALIVKPEPGKPGVPLRVSRVGVSVVVVGGFARTTLDLTFRNDLDRILEGELVLPLPRGATISGFALDLSGKLREASVVEREKARVVFEEVVRKNVDPGLVEWVKGNAFRTRVYPIPAKGTKRCVLTFHQPLFDRGDGKARYLLPLGFGHDLDEYAQDTQLSADGPHLAQVTLGPVKPADLVLDLPLTEKQVAVEKARVKVAGSTEAPFVFVARVPVPAFETKPVTAKRLTVLWDASGSAASRDQAKELAFLEGWIAKAGVEQVTLLPFSNAVWSKGGGSFAVKEGKSPELLAAIKAIKPDGGTSLSCLALAKWDETTDHYLLFSDGLSNFGEGELVAGEKAVTCIASAPTNDWAALEKIARRGALVNVRELATDEALKRALVEPRVLLRVENADAVYPEAPARLEGGSITVTGRVAEKKTVVLHFGAGASEAAKVEVLVDPAAETTTGEVERVWATRRVDSLLARKENEEEATRFAKAHRLVTPVTSLLVLDSIDDYVRYKIEPPAELLEEWEKRIESERGAEAKTREARLESVRARWKARVEWWEKKFEMPPPGTKFADPSKEEGAPGVGGGGGAGGERERRAMRRSEAPSGAPARDAAPPPAPSAEPKPMEESDEKSDADLNGNATAPLAKKMKGDSKGDAAKSIALKPWDPNTPYIAAFKKVTEPDALYATYLAQKAENASSTAFYLDSADYFYQQKLPELALRILSNVAELQLENAPLLRILAYRLLQAGELDLAIAVFRAVPKIRPEEPQSWRDLGLALAEAKDWTGAVANLEKVVLGQWDGRFPDVEIITLGELNDVLSRAEKAGVAPGKLTTLPPDVRKLLDVDLRIILTWDADNTDMDLWVVEPTGEKAFYGYTLTRIGGSFGKDFTGGYGPEEYLIRRAMKGTYKIQVNYYGSRQQLLAGDTTIQITLVRNWGRPDEVRKAVTRRLKDKQEVLDIAEIEVP